MQFDVNSTCEYFKDYKLHLHAILLSFKNFPRAHEHQTTLEIILLPTIMTTLSLISDIRAKILIADWHKISRHPEFFVDRTPSEYNLMLLPVVVKSSLPNAEGVGRGGEGWGG